MFRNDNISIDEFVSLTNSGLHVADFVQVKTALIARYKQIYGSDIDLSTASADGIFVNDLALIINNILMTMSSMYSNLDVNSATGKYLDDLCRLANVQRRPASNSSASINITNLSTSTVVIPAKIEVIDKAGIIWMADNAELELQPGQADSFRVVCSQSGPVTAPAGWIDRTIYASLDIQVEQSEAAIEGSYQETDSELRLRRSQSFGSAGVTVLESLYGALREISDIVDVKIYNNATNSDDYSPADGTIVKAHNIYVILRVKQGVVIDDSVIGTLIYEKLTPGISTTRFTEEYDFGTSKQYDYVPVIIGSAAESLTQTIYWKQAKGVHSGMTVTIRPFAYFDADLTQSTSLGSNDTFSLIGRQLIEYVNALPIGVRPNVFDLQSIVIEADPLFKSNKTFSVEAITQPDSNFDQYYDFSQFTVQKVQGSNTDYIITFS